MKVGGSRHIAVAASLLLHAGALALAWQLPPSGAMPRPAQAVLVQLTLPSPAESHAADTAIPSSLPSLAPRERGNSPPAPTAAQQDIASQSASADIAPTTSEIAESVAVTDAVATHDTAAPAATTARYTGDQVMASLEKTFAAHFYYPMLARRKGWEGEVTVGLRVEIDGRLTGIHVVSSSGYRVLDNAAVDSLLRARAVLLPGGALGDSLDMILPVQYRLLDAQV